MPGMLLPLARLRDPLPGFPLAIGVTLFWLGLIVLLPLSTLMARSAGEGWAHFAGAAFNPRALASYRLTFGTALLAAAVNALFGLLVTWVLVRYSFPGKRLFGAMIDLPFALPTAVAGIALTTLYADTGLLGAPLAAHGIRVAYTPLGIFVALLFIGLPFIVRTLEPVLAEVSSEQEEAALTLGATRWQTFRRIILPTLFPALATGFALAFARGAGEYGSVIFIAGNMPYKSEISPLLIVTRLEEYDYAGAAAIATVMLAVSFVLLLLLNLLQRWQRGRSS
ncbi:sulfate ABC transporter permease subunit CysT [Sphingomonas ginkgonis]|uniref:Sulfate transport system permease protein CysT n=1 Tax=Sphingomonas ginkgonis TaxID=2315330 RepID=A0A3R9X8W7_9SPHN|nr:sulfate ABC transporter permease subunit CysT [Sphingomonas ginkgonis]RST31536.1 sulfate ABC transporter permease subunit CysT [Sphingomonas ginkgonis]